MQDVSRFRKSILPCLGLVALAALHLPSAARAQDAGAPSSPAAHEEHDARVALAHDMANMVLCIIKDQKKNNTDRQASLRQGFANVVDIDWIAKFVLGNAWRNASDEQRARYTRLYHDYLINMYVANYAESSERKITDIKVLSVDDADGERFTTRTQISLSSADDLHVDYLAQRDGDGYKIIDVVIEGVSLLSTHRSEFSKLTANGSVDTVIARLKQLVEPDQFAMLTVK